MQELYKKLEKYDLEDAIKFEENDRQFLALGKLWNSFTSPPNTPGCLSLEQSSIHLDPLSFAGEGEIRSNYLFLIIANAIICYQLSWKWEDYWEEFWEYLLITPPPFVSLQGTPLEKGRFVTKKQFILEFFEKFLPNSKNNKRFVKVKLKRIEKLLTFFDKFIWREEYYYENMIVLRDDLAEMMNQRYDAKTIVFAVKMFSYGARSCYNRIIYFPDNISIPIDSRLIKIFDKYGPHPNPLPKGEGIKKFYSDLSKKLWIPELHLDAILWNSRGLI